MKIPRVYDFDHQAEFRGEDSESPQIGGVGSVFYDGTPATEFRISEGMRERIMPTAFDRAVIEDDVRGLVDHDGTKILGRTKSGTMRLRTIERGLDFTIDPPDTTAARDIMVSMKRGDVTGSSFGFLPRPGGVRWRRDGNLEIRELTDVWLRDVSVVTYPAYEAAESELRSKMAVECFDRHIEESDHHRNELVAVDLEKAKRRLQLALTR